VPGNHGAARSHALCGAALALACGLASGLPDASAEEPARLIAAVGSSSLGDRHGTQKLFDLDEATTWCAREKARVSVGMKLSRVTSVAAARIALGNYGDWSGGPRVKQVFVTVLDGDKVVKKVRHKWPDRDEPRDGTVNLRASGDAVLVEFDLVYAGTGSGGLCISGIALDELGEGGAAAPIDTADLAQAAWGKDAIEKLLPGLYTSWRPGPEGDVAAKLELTKRGRFEYRDDALDLAVEGKWKLTRAGADAPLRLSIEIRKAKAGGKRIGFPAGALDAPWRFAPLGEGGAPGFIPWIAFGRDEKGDLSRIDPTRVTAVQP
jgi:hypothetical protein